MTNLEIYTPKNLTKQEWETVEFDKYDLLMACGCGVVAGIVDMFFVNNPKNSKLGKITDKGADDLVKKFASFTGWNPKSSQEDNIASAIGHLERKFAINYDQRNSVDVHGLFDMNTKNHHFKSLSHSPDIVGLFFSILDQFSQTSTFIADEKITVISTENNKFELRGSDFKSKLYCAFCNWIGHIMSDLAGSSGSRGNNLLSRGMGVPIPFMEFFQFCKFGSFQIKDDRQDLATLMTRVYQEGYDLRFGVTLSIPVFIEEMSIRVLWAIKRHYSKNIPWSDCINFNQHTDFRLLLIIGNSTLCLLDLGKAAIKAKGNKLILVTNLNLIAWFRLLFLVLREAKTELGPYVQYVMDKLFTEVMTENELHEIQEYYYRIQRVDETINEALIKFIKYVEVQSQAISYEVEQMSNNKISNSEQANHSINLARMCNVNEDKIVHDLDELNDYFGF